MFRGLTVHVYYAPILEGPYPRFYYIYIMGGNLCTGVKFSPEISPNQGWTITFIQPRQAFVHFGLKKFFCTASTWTFASQNIFEDERYVVTKAYKLLRSH